MLLLCERDSTVDTVPGGEDQQHLFRFCFAAVVPGKKPFVKSFFLALPALTVLMPQLILVVVHDQCLPLRIDSAAAIRIEQPVVDETFSWCSMGVCAPVRD